MSRHNSRFIMLRCNQFLIVYFCVLLMIGEYNPVRKKRRKVAFACFTSSMS